MKTYAVVIHLEIDDDETWSHPASWLYDELIGSEVRAVTVYDVTDEPVERVRIDAEGVEEMA